MAAALALCLLLVLAAPPAAAAPPLAPGLGAIDALAERLQGLPLPSPVEGEVRVAPVAEERRFRRSFLDTLAALPGWRGEGIVVAAGTHRLEELAVAIARPDLLRCADGACRLTAPLAIETGAVLVIDQLTVALEQSTGAVIVSFGELFFSAAVIMGRDGEALATTDGTTVRPFIVAYDASRTLIRDSRLEALGYDAFGTTGLAFLAANRDEPAGHPELEMVNSVIEDVFDGVFVRSGGKTEIVRNTVTMSGRHGVVLRDGTAAALVAANTIVGSGALADNGNGVVISRGTAGAVISDNAIEDSGGSAILVNHGSANLSIVGNTLAGSGRDGLVVYESSSLDLLDNTIVGSGRSGIRVRSSDGIRIEANALRENARAGLDLHDWSVASREPTEEEEALIRPTAVTATGNSFAANARGDCATAGAVTVLPESGHDC